MDDPSRARLLHETIFVCRYSERWPALFAGGPLPDPDSCAQKIITNEDCWVVLTFLHLKKAGLNVGIAPRFIPGKICVVSSLDMTIRDWTFDSFVVGCRSDGHEPELCDFAIVQNEFGVNGSNRLHLPHWPQPGLIPRAPERGTRVECLVFKGGEINLHETFRSVAFHDDLARLGVRLVINGRTPREVHWHDYSNNDLVLAVRNLTEIDALVKPASKLINAWIAGVPALLGPEPAFRCLRKSPLDYIEVFTPQQVLNAIGLFKDQPDLYSRMIANGHARAEEYTVERMRQRWIDSLNGPIAQHFESWKCRNRLGRVLSFAKRSWRHKAAMKRAAYHRFNGRRILDQE